jgi:hypothetical protein
MSTALCASSAKHAKIDKQLGGVHSLILYWYEFCRFVSVRLIALAYVISQSATYDET